MSVTAAQGFRAAGVAAGLKASGEPDVALVVNDGPLSAVAGVLTSNRVHAAPVAWTRRVIAGGTASAVVLNSGGANACTGDRGVSDTEQTAQQVAKLLNVPSEHIAVCSTGVIGEYLPMPELLRGVEFASERLNQDAGGSAAEAILTTDTITKSSRVSVGGFTVGGMAKGAGMLSPGLATMLCVLTTDAVVTSEELQTALAAATSRTFDRIDSDGCMSTNDAVLLLASGASGTTPSPSALADAVFTVCGDLARQLIADAEGASKDIAIEVVQASSEQDAVEVGRAIARSNLFKCAVHGEDPNWGRVLSAVGTTSATFDPNQLAVAMNGVWVCRDGAAAEDRNGVDLSSRVVRVIVDLNAGDDTATIWTNDLTAEYVHENSAYST